LRKVAAQIRDQPEDHLLTPKNSVLVIIDQNSPIPAKNRENLIQAQPEIIPGHLSVLIPDR
jgi:hypothetical protein